MEHNVKLTDEDIETINSLLSIEQETFKKYKLSGRGDKQADAAYLESLALLQEKIARHYKK